DSYGADRPEILHAKFKAAVIEQIGKVLVGLPAFTLDKTREAPEIFELGGFAGAWTIPENIRRSLTSRSRPRWTTLANFFVEPLESRRDVRQVAAEGVLESN